MTEVSEYPDFRGSFLATVSERGLLAPDEPCFSEWSGYEKDEAHELLKAMFARDEIRLPSGEAVERVRSTARMSVEDFNDYTARVERFLIGHGFEFPDAA